MPNIGRPRLGLALGGGAALGLAHIGVLKCLDENGIQIDALAGTSAGAAIGSCYAFGLRPNEILDKARGLSWFKLANLSYSKMGIASASGIAELIESFLGDVEIENADMPLAIVATDIESGDKVVIRSGIVSKAVAASACIPGIFAPYELQGKDLMDGSLVEDLPLGALADLGVDVAIAVDLHRFRKFKRPGNVIDVMTNAMDILVANQESVRFAKQINIEPHLEPFTPSDFDRADEIVAAGYKAAQESIPAIKAIISRKQRKMPIHKGFFSRLLARVLSKI